ncbi:MAG: glycerol-3-phosphate 1-O-acyltransferase PlsY [Rhodospirillaceae bacterium]|nr:glycerol-3-phosphate 1-O-acyltransferase PlsY [Rhodospirillaceae bacterium]
MIEALAAVLGYLLGSIPFGLVLTKAAGLGDIRSIGSGNIGATNVLRTGHKGLALATLLLDGGKGAVAVLLARWLIGEESAYLIAGVAAVLGHNFPVWLKFKGGKGVATTLGTMLAVAPYVGLAACLTWLGVALLFRYSSLAALIALAVAPLYAELMVHDHWVALAFLALAVLGWIRHRANLARLKRGEEPKIGAKK